MKHLRAALAFVTLGTLAIPAVAHADIAPPTCAELANGSSCRTDDAQTGQCMDGVCVALTADNDSDDDSCATGGVVGGLTGLGVALLALGMRSRRTAPRD